MTKPVRYLSLCFPVVLSGLLGACDNGMILGGEDDWVVDAPESHGVYWPN